VWGDGHHAVWGATFRMLEQLMGHVNAIGSSSGASAP
jgi:hypothetical protein